MTGWAAVARLAGWWVLGLLTATAAGEAEHVRQSYGGSPALCIGSTILLRGTACIVQARQLQLGPL